MTLREFKESLERFPPECLDLPVSVSYPDGTYNDSDSYSSSTEIELTWMVGNCIQIFVSP